jgi:hypothetical protein
MSDAEELTYVFRRRTVTVGELRARIAADLGTRPVLVRLVLNYGREVRGGGGGG